MANRDPADRRPFSKRRAYSTLGANPDNTRLFDQRRVFEHRLEDGYQRIEVARLSGRDVEAWEEFWVQLLREYEGVCDELGRLAA